MEHTFSLRTSRLRLRAMEPEDLDFFYEVENNTELWCCGNSNVPYSRYALRRFLSESRNDLFADGQLRLVVEECAGHEPLGCLDVMSFDPLHSRAEVGIVVVPHRQRDGIGKEAMQLLLSYLGDYLRLHQVYAYVSERNTAACALFRSLGFSESARLADWLRLGEEHVAALLFQKLF